MHQEQNKCPHCKSNLSLVNTFPSRRVARTYVIRFAGVIIFTFWTSSSFADEFIAQELHGDPEYDCKFGFSVDAAERYILPYKLEYPFGWQGIALNGFSPGKSPINIACAPLKRSGAVVGMLLKRD